MEELRLVTPDASMLEEIRAYRQAMLEAGSAMDGTCSLKDFEAPAAWIAYNEAMLDEARVPEGMVPSTEFVCVRESDGRIVGMLNLRHRLNDYLLAYGGHIGYSVRPDERRKGYAHWMLSQALPYCRALGLERVMVSCIAANEGSRRTILGCGGVYESTAHEPEMDVDIERYWITL